MFRASILVVEDEKIVALTLKRKLESLDYYVLDTLATGEDAVRLVGNFLPDLILMDIKLGGELDGIAAASKIRESFDIPIVYLTAYSDDDTINRAKITEPFGYLIKPFHERELQTTIEIALYKHKMERRLRESEASLQASQDRLAGILKTAEDAIISINEKRRINLFNAGAEKIFGYKAEAAIGQSLDLLIPERFHQSHGRFITEFDNGPEKTRSLEKRRELIGRRQDGSEFPCEGSISKLVLEGETVLTVMLRDVTYRKQLESRLKEIHHLGQELALIHDEVKIIDRVLKAVANTLNFEVALCGRVDELTNTLHYCYKIINGVYDELLFDVPLDGKKGVGSHVAVTGQPLRVVNTDQDQRFIPLPGVDLRSVLCVPIKANGRILGVLYGGNIAPRDYTDSDLQLLQTLADKAATAMENARLYGEIQRQNEELAVLNEAGQEMASTLNLEVILEKIMGKVRELFKAEEASVLLIDEARLNLVYRATSSKRESNFLGKKIPIREELTEGIIRNWRTKITKNVSEGSEDRHNTDDGSELTDQEILTVPLVYHSMILGSIEVIKETGEIFLKSEINLLESLANSAALAIGNARLYKAEQTNRKEMDAVRRATLSLTASLNLDLVLDEIAQNALRLISGDDIHIFLLDNGKLEFGTAFDFNGKLEKPIAVPRPNGLTSATLRAGDFVLVSDIRNHPLFEDAPANWKGTILGLPLKIGATNLGVMTICKKEPNTITPYSIKILQLLADQASIAVENAWLFKSEQQARKRAETLHATNMALSKTLDLETILNILLHRLGQLVPLDRSCILLVEEENQLKVRASHGYEKWYNNGEEMELIHLDVRTTPNLKLMFSTGEGLIISNVKNYPGWVEVLDRPYDCCWMGVPIKVGDEILGIYSVENDTPGYYKNNHLTLLQMLAAPAAISIKNALLYQETQEHLYNLMVSQAQLIQSEKVGALGRLAASVAHEINNPLQAIDTCVNLMQEDLENQSYDSLGRYLGVTSNEINRIAEIVTQMRDFYRPAEQEHQLVDIQDILDNVLILTRKQIEHNEVRLTVNGAEERHLVTGNPAHLKQVFLNLILNAIDSMPEGGELHISISLEQMYLAKENETKSAIGISFRDTGYGIPKNIQDRLFEPFFTTKKAGTGLGLTISHGIINAHGGQIQVLSEVGKGTTFTILLPQNSSVKSSQHPNLLLQRQYN